MLLSYDQLVELVQIGVINDAEPGNINGTSIDVRLGGSILREYQPLGGQRTVDLRKRQATMVVKQDIPEEGILLRPGDFILASTLESFNLPLWLSADFHLKSSVARMGLEHMMAGWCDPGWTGSVLTLELKNMLQYHSIRLYKGDCIGQMVFWRHAMVPEEMSYAKRGRYNGDSSVSGAKP